MNVFSLKYYLVNRIRFLLFFIILFFSLDNAFAGGQFVVFDATLYANKPNLKSFGLYPITVIYGQEFWPGKKNMEKLPANFLECTTEAELQVLFNDGTDDALIVT